MIDYACLDPGIVEAVRFLNEIGYQTTDSGDGVTKFAKGLPDDCAIPFPHVVCSGAVGSNLVLSAMSLRDELRAKFNEDWDVQVSYDTKDRQVLLFAYKGGWEQS